MLLIGNVHTAEDFDDECKIDVDSIMIEQGDVVGMFLQISILFQLISLIAKSFVINDPALSARMVYAALKYGDTLLQFFIIAARVDLNEPANHGGWWVNWGQRARWLKYRQ